MMSLFLIFLLSLLFTPYVVLSYEPSQQDIVDAILGRRVFTPEQLKQMDINQDEKVDVADLVYFLQPKVTASFVTKESIIDESLESHDVLLNFSGHMIGTAKYTVGGTATPDIDYVKLSGSVSVNGHSAFITIRPIKDTVFEGNETIKITLLPSTDYQLGTQTTHTVNLRDNPNESSADYVFDLSIETMGVEGNTNEQTGFPPALFSRKARINLTFSQGNILKAALNTTKSIGTGETVSGATVIPSTSLSYTSKTLEMVFEYPTKCDGLVSDASIITFDYEHPSLGNQTLRDLVNTLTLRIEDFDITADKFTNKLLKGTFSLRISGFLREGTATFFKGSLLGTMQQ
jgi:hypothetical protein